MKLSVSVPDALWDAARKAIPVGSPSELVQEALRRACAAGTGKPSYAQVPAENEELAAAIAAAEEHLLSEARELYQSGYTQGVQLAAKLRWTSLASIVRGGLRYAAQNNYRVVHEINTGQVLDDRREPHPELAQFLGEFADPRFEWSPHDLEVDGMERALKDLWGRVNSPDPASPEPDEDR